MGAPPRHLLFCDVPRHSMMPHGSPPFTLGHWFAGGVCAFPYAVTPGLSVIVILRFAYLMMRSYWAEWFAWPSASAAVP